MTSSYLPVGSSHPLGKSPRAAIDDAIARAKEIAVRLTSKSVQTLPESLSKEKESASEDGFLNEHRDGSAHVLSYAVSPRSLKTTIEFKVPGYKVGLIIGTRGDTLKRIENVTETKITFDQVTASNNYDAQERCIFITGLPDDCQNAKRMVLERIDETYRKSNSTGIPVQPPIHRDVYGNPLPSVQFTIPNSKVGLAIGKGGETIRELQETTGAKIFIAPDSCCSEGQPERLISIYGSEEAIQMARSVLDEVISGNRQGNAVSDIVPEYNGRNTVVMVVPDNMVGLIIGKKGDNFKLMIQQSKAKIVIDPPVSNGSSTRSISITGSADSIAIAQSMIYDKLSGSGNVGGVCENIPCISNPNEDQDVKTVGHNNGSVYGAISSNEPTHKEYTPDDLDKLYNYYHSYYLNYGMDETSAAGYAVAVMESYGISYKKQED